jgi:hypothetical protein
MPFTRVPAQSYRREESKGFISSSKPQKMKKNEEGNKIWKIRCLLLKRKNVKGQRRIIQSQNNPASEKTEFEPPKIAIF